MMQQPRMMPQVQRQGLSPSQWMQQQQMGRAPIAAPQQPPPAQSGQMPPQNIQWNQIQQRIPQFMQQFPGMMQKAQNQRFPQGMTSPYFPQQQPRIGFPEQNQRRFPIGPWQMNNRAIFM